MKDITSPNIQDCSGTIKTLKVNKFMRKSKTPSIQMYIKLYKNSINLVTVRSVRLHICETHKILGESKPGRTN